MASPYTALGRTLSGRKQQPGEVEEAMHQHRSSRSFLALLQRYSFNELWILREAECALLGIFFRRSQLFGSSGSLPLPKHSCSRNYPKRFAALCEKPPLKLLGSHPVDVFASLEVGASEGEPRRATVSVMDSRAMLRGDIGFL